LFFTISCKLLLLGCNKSKIEDTKTCAVLDADGNFPTSLPKDPTIEHAKKSEDKYAESESAARNMEPQESSAGFIMAVCTIVSLVFVAICGFFYAYTHPHSSMGQFLIQYGRPAAWSWRRGEARYTAATIHM